MFRKISLYAFGLFVFVILLVCLLLPQVYLYMKVQRIPPTGDGVIERANDLLDVINNFAAILGAVLAFFSVIIGILAWLGANLYGSLRKVNDELEEKKNELDKQVSDLRKEAENTRIALLDLNLAERLLSQNETRYAMKYYDEALKRLPGDLNVIHFVGRMYSNLGDFNAAITLLETVLLDKENIQTQNKEKLAEILKDLGLAYRRRGTDKNVKSDYDRAIEYLNESKKLNADDSDTYSILGGLYRRLQKYEQAWQVYKEAWETDRGSSYAIGNLASLSWYLDKIEEAETYFRLAKLLADDRIKNGTREGYWDFYDVALARLALGEGDGAIEAYRQAIKFTPGPVQLEGVLDNLKFLKQSKTKLDRIDEVIQMIQDAQKAAL